MADVTVEQFAEVLKVPVDKLLSQLDEAGIKVSGSEDTISDDAKLELLTHLRRSHGQDDTPATAAAPRRITLKRKSQSELRLSGAQGRSRTVNVEVRKKRTYIKRGETPDKKADQPAPIAADRADHIDDAEYKRKLALEARREAEEQEKSNSSLSSGLLVVLILIYALLAIPFRSYGQPFIVMSVIPFGVVGAILGHIIVMRDLSFLSIVGMLALTGVVVNDSLVLVDTINQKRKQGASVWEATSQAGAMRFRPVLLTSLTTFAGLTPLLLDFSTQAEFLKQMAISLGFGILFATVITLILVPINYVLAYQFKHAVLRFWHGPEYQAADLSLSGGKS